MEIWKDIPNYPNYEISDLGRVRNKRRNSFLKYGGDKYKLVVLCHEGHKRSYLVHRLVAEAFIPNPYNKPEVNHKNENKWDNRAENLEWCTRLYNIRYGTGIERKAQARRNDPRSSTPVKQLSLDGEYIKTFESLHEMQRQTGYDRAFVVRCVKGENPTAYGYKWQFDTSNINE